MIKILLISRREIDRDSVDKSTKDISMRDIGDGFKKDANSASLVVFKCFLTNTSKILKNCKEEDLEQLKEMDWSNILGIKSIIPKNKFDMMDLED